MIFGQSRASRPLPGPTFQFGDFELNCARFQLLRKGRPLRVERKPMELQILLASREGELVSRTEIAEKLWSSEVFVDTEHGINTAIRKLRHLMGDDSAAPRYIQTVTGLGYRFIAPIKDINRERIETNNLAISLPASLMDSKAVRDLDPPPISAKPQPEPSAAVAENRNSQRGLWIAVDIFAVLLVAATSQYGSEPACLASAESQVTAGHYLNSRASERTTLGTAT